jgi:hypothetical protein
MALRTAILALAMALTIALVGPVSFAQKAKSSSKSPAKAPARPATKKKVTPSRKATVRRKTARSRRTVARRAPAPVNQRVPTKDRYAEIQQALADAGYFKGEADGGWNQDSVEALKAFQDANGFEPTGKIDPRSLIKLGLGPRYESSSAPSPTSPVQGANQGASQAAQSDVREPG